MPPLPKPHLPNPAAAPNRRPSSSLFSSFTALALGAACLFAGPFASAITISDEFTGGAGGVPPGWAPLAGLSDPAATINHANGVVTITDSRAANGDGGGPALIQSSLSLGTITSFAAQIDIASMSGNQKMITAVGNPGAYALVVQFNPATYQFEAFVFSAVAGQASYKLPSPTISPPAAPAGAEPSVGALSFLIQSDAATFRIFCPALNYDSGSIPFVSANLQGFHSPIDFGSAATLLIGTSAEYPSLSGTTAFERVQVNGIPLIAEPPPTGTTFADHFTGNSGGVPAGWTDIGQDTNAASTVVENGTVVTITDTRGNGGPQFIQSNNSIGSINAFALTVDIASMTASNGSQPQAMAGLGKIPAGSTAIDSLFLVRFDSVTKGLQAMILGPTQGAMALPGTLSTYAGGAISFTVRATNDSFRVVSAALGYDSGSIPFSSVVPGFTLAALGGTPGLIIGTESAGAVTSGTPSSIAYDRVELISSAVNQAPVANAGADQSIHAGSTVTLSGSASFDDNTASTNLRYAWSFVSKPAGSAAALGNAGSSAPTFVADATGDYELQLIVTDDQGLSSTPDTVVISSNNVAPTAVATADFNLAIVGTAVHFNGAGSTDPENDALTHAWSITTAPVGSTATLSGANTATPSLVVDKVGTFKVTLVVSDFLGAGTSATVEVVATQPATNPEVQIIYASDIVEVLPLSKVTTKGNQEAFVNFLKQATKFLQKGDKSGAVSKLKSAMERADGFTLRGALDGNGASRDWITDRQTQLDVYALLKAAVSALE